MNVPILAWMNDKSTIETWFVAACTHLYSVHNDGRTVYCGVFPHPHIIQGVSMHVNGQVKKHTVNGNEVWMVMAGNLEHFT